MTLSEMLLPDKVLIKEPCASKDELISRLLEQIYSTDRTPPLPPMEMHKKIQIREEIGGTLLPSGLSVPHSKLAGYEGFIIAMGTTAEPIFHQGLQIRLMALMISNQTGSPWYLPTLALLTKISRDTEYFQRLCGAENFDGFIEILRERDQEIV